MSGVQCAVNIFVVVVHVAANGKDLVCAVSATCTLLRGAIVGMFKHNQLFDGTKVYAALEVPAPAPAPVPQEVLCP